MKRAIITFAVLAAAGAVVWMRGQITRPQPSPPASELQAVTLIFGSKDPEPAKWDGAASLSAGRIEKIIGYHFTETCRVLDGHAWECSTHPWPRFGGGMHPNEKGQPRATPVEPVGVTIHFRAPADAEFRIKVPTGEFSFRPQDVPLTGGIFPLAATVEVYRTPVVESITDGEYEDDYPSIRVSGGEVTVAWQGYRNEGEHVFTRSWRDGRWGERRQVTRQPADVFAPRLLDEGGVVWSERDGQSWHLKGAGGKTYVSGEGNNLFLRAAGSHAVYQKWRKGRSDIYYSDLKTGGEVLLSDPKRHPRANDWSPDVAVDRNGVVWVAWDGYAEGSYNIYLRPVRKGKPGELIRVTDSLRFHAHSSLAVDAQNRLWVAWDEAPENWGKDVGFLLGGGTGLYDSRSIQVAVYAQGQWMVPLRQPEDVVPYAYRRYFQTPRLVADSLGNMWLFARPRTSSRLPTSLWAAGGKWEVVGTYYSGDRWSELLPVPGTVGRNEGGLDAAADAQGNVWVAAVTDNRLWGGPNFGHPPQNNDIVVARLRAGGPSPDLALAARPPEPPAGRPSEPREREQIAALRNYAVQAGGKTYRVHRGDMHRHTDISLDGAGDGSLWDAYRYALDAAGFDYFVVTDHQSGAQEYTWWRIDKSADMFHVPGFFTALYGTERSLGYPNGHRNLVFARRGVKILPIGPAEQKAAVNTGSLLYPYLRQNGGIATSHTSHTGMGTDWRDNDPDLEPIVEIFQGARTSAEHEGAPLSPTAKRTELWAGGYRPLGFVWNAWAKGYKLGVQASSDHVSTHLSYACVIAEDSSREALLDAMRKRRTYAATANILLDYRVTAGGVTYLQGDAFTSSEVPELWARIAGTGPLRKVDVIRDNQYIFTQEPKGETYELRYRENALAPGEHYYYVRVEQQDGNVAWSSPVWVRRP
jgi:hypothetical protein